MVANLVLASMLLLLWSTAAHASDLLPGFTRSPFFNEQVREEKLDCGVRMLVNAPGAVDPKRPTLVIFYATPNGSSIEQTLGCQMTPDLDWHFDIQHVAAQTRVLRQVDKRENIVLVCTQADIRSWPAWRQKHADGGAIIRKMVEDTIKLVPGSEVKVVLTGHSGGGSFIFGFINSGESIPAYVRRIAFLDANYSYHDEDRHGDKLLAWLRSNPENHLAVIAYDDRNIMLDGKPVITTGGTFRATHRMLNRFERDAAIKRGEHMDFDRYDGLGGQMTLFIHRNPANKILHTALVGEMNGYLEAMTLGTPEESKWGKFGGPRAYSKWVQPSPMSVQSIPPRPANAEGGAAVMKRATQLPIAERETAVLNELKAGNLPGFLRSLATIRVDAADANGKSHKVIYQVMPDYLSVGSDSDFVRVPLTPMTAQAAAYAYGCALPTRKMVDDIYRQAAVKLEPKPLTQDREAVETFVQHNSIIEGQRTGKPLGALVAGIKKDVVVTNKLLERPNHVAIYGWHKLDGSPIQPLTTVHINTYVDYSHGIRLVKRTVLVDGNPRDVREVLSDPVLHPLLSDEGPITSNR